MKPTKLFLTIYHCANTKRCREKAGKHTKKDYSIDFDLKFVFASSNEGASNSKRGRRREETAK
jgi:hypothetical protein